MPEGVSGEKIVSEGVSGEKVDRVLEEVSGQKVGRVLEEVSGQKIDTDITEQEDYFSDEDYVNEEVDSDSDTSLQTCLTDHRKAAETAYSHFCTLVNSAEQ